MIDTTQPPPEGRQLVQAYGPSHFTVSGVIHRSSILILPDRTLPWLAPTASEATIESLAVLGRSQIELLLVGTGQGFSLLSADLRAGLRGWRIAAEAMTTPAACRTYNVLATEGRRVAAALIPV